MQLKGSLAAQCLSGACLVQVIVLLAAALGGAHGLRYGPYTIYDVRQFVNEAVRSARGEGKSMGWCIGHGGGSA